MHSKQLFRRRLFAQPTTPAPGKESRSLFARLLDRLAGTPEARHAYGCGRGRLHPDCRACLEIRWAAWAARSAAAPEVRTGREAFRRRAA